MVSRPGVVIVASILLATSVQAQVEDHLTCYRIGDGQRLGGIVDLDSAALGLEAGCELTKGKLYCVPSTKTVVEAHGRGGEPIDLLPIAGLAAPGARICYRVRCPRREIPDQEVSDQFGHRELRGPRAELVCTPAIAGPPPTSTSTTTTTTTTSTTTTTLRVCRVDSVLLDPEDTITALVPGGQQVPLRVQAGTSPGGVFDLLLADGGIGGSFVCPPAGCHMGVFVIAGGSVDLAFGYTPPASPPPTIRLSARLTPHSVPFTCGPGSSEAVGLRNFPVGP